MKVTLIQATPNLTETIAKIAVETKSFTSISKADCENRRNVRGN